MNQPLQIATMGCRWVLDLTRLDKAPAERLRELWQRTAGWEPEPDEPEGFPRTLEVGYLDGPDRLPEGIEIGRDISTASYELSGALTLKCLTTQAGRMTLLHSAALALPESGATVILVAESGTGKTTASRVLGQHLGYLSDETAAIRADGTLIAHAKPLSVIPAPGEPKVEFAPDEAGLLRPPAGPAWLAATLLLDRDPDHPQPTLEPVDLLTALSEVIPQSSSLPEQEQPLDTLARALTSGAGVHRLRYAEITDAVDLVLDLLRRVPRDTHAERAWEIIEPPARRRTPAWEPSPAWESGDLESAARIVRAPWRDALRDPATDELFVLNGPMPLRLFGLGASIWSACIVAQSVSELIARIIEEHGEHPDAEALVRDAITVLAGQGLLQPAD